MKDESELMIVVVVVVVVVVMMRILSMERASHPII